ncbi:MAG: hypothetical protein RL641_612 [Candidatus Parcubacteria bacterium]|jgi:hypothetical protein
MKQTENTLLMETLYNYAWARINTNNSIPVLEKLSERPKAKKWYGLLSIDSKFYDTLIGQLLVGKYISVEDGVGESEIDGKNVIYLTLAFDPELSKDQAYAEVEKYIQKIYLKLNSKK